MSSVSRVAFTLAAAESTLLRIAEPSHTRDKGTEILYPNLRCKMPIILDPGFILKVLKYKIHGIFGQLIWIRYFFLPGSDLLPDGSGGKIYWIYVSYTM